MVFSVHFSLFLLTDKYKYSIILGIIQTWCVNTKESDLGSWRKEDMEKAVRYIKDKILTLSIEMMIIYMSLCEMMVQWLSRLLHLPWNVMYKT